MSTVLSRIALVVVVISALLMAPLAANVWAKEGRSKGGRSQNNSRSKRVEKSPRQGCIRQSPPSAPVMRKNIRVHSPAKSAADSTPRRESPIARIPEFSPKSNRPGIFVKTHRASPDVEVKPNPEPKEHGRIRPDKTDRIAIPIESPKSDLKPDREQRHNPGRDFDETFRRPRPRPRPKPEPEPDDLTLRKWDIQSRHQKIGRAPKTDFIRSPRSTISFGKGDHDFFRFRSAFTQKVAYEDRSHIGKRKFNHDHVFRDRRHRLVNRIIWPGYHFPVHYKWGHHHRFHYVYPFYHRRYIFVSLGGFWPDYTSLRYYWYPAHDFWWYGYYPVAQEVGGDTYNYYTYNYYGQQGTTTDYIEGASGIRPVDSNTFADVREKLSKEQKGPDAEAPADVLFDEGVKAFEQGLFAQAVEKFEKAITLAPDDMILPFAYSQALLADGRYAKAAEVLRLALMKSSPDKEGVYFPRGLYLDENVLISQIDLLTGKAENNPSDSDLQILLGYQWLGIGEVEKSLEPLRKAKEDPKNSAASDTLLALAEKIQAGETQ